MEVKFIIFYTLITDGELSDSCHHYGKGPFSITISQEVGQDPEPVWTY
jgi:hypothetical protein